MKDARFLVLFLVISLVLLKEGIRGETIYFCFFPPNESCSFLGGQARCVDATIDGCDMFVDPNFGNLYLQSTKGGGNTSSPLYSFGIYVADTCTGTGPYGLIMKGHDIPLRYCKAMTLVFLGYLTDYAFFPSSDCPECIQQVTTPIMMSSTSGPSSVSNVAVRSSSSTNPVVTQGTLPPTLPTSALCQSCSCQNASSSFTVSCQSKAIQDANFNFPLQTTSIDMSFNSLNTVPSSFAYLSNLTVLLLSSNNIESFSPFCFLKLTSLSLLNLTLNSLETLPPGVFSQTKNLTIIDVSRNKLRGLHFPLYVYFPILMKADFSGNYLPKVDGQFSDCEFLLVLLLQSNRITSVTVFSLSGLLRLTYLDLSNNRLKSFSGYYLDDLVSLKTLLLKGNMITSISTSFSSTAFPQLDKLDLSYNKLPFLKNDSFVGCSKLRLLYLAHNQITTIQYGAFSALYNLQYVDLSYNHLPFIPLGLFADSSSLYYLNFASNRITELVSANFSPLKLLDWLDLRSNQISVISNLAFEGLKKLTLLELSSNGLTTFPPNIFSPMTALNRLYLSGNIFTNFSDDSFAGLPSLTFLKLKLCGIERPPVAALSRLSNITVLDLSFNRMSIFEPGLFSSLRRPLSLNLGGNPSFCILSTLGSLVSCACAPGLIGNGTFCLPFCPWNLVVLDNGPTQTVVCNTTTSPEYGGMTCSASCGIFPQMSTQFSCSNSGTWVSSAGLAFNISEWQKQCRVFNCGPLEMQEAALKGDEYYLYCPETLSNGTGCSVGCGQGYAGNRSVFQCDAAAERWTGVLPNCSRSTGSGTSDSSASSSSGSSLIVIIIAVVVVSIALVLVGLGAAVLARRRSQARLDPAPDGSRPKEAKGAGDGVESVDALINSPYISSAISSTYAHVFSSASVERTRFMQMEVALEDLEIVGELGEGNYGVVRKGRLRKDGKPFVAVKSVHADAPLMTQQRMILEAMLMCRLVHPHIVGLVGLCSTVNPFLIITEFMAGGGLVDYLRACQAERGAKRRAVLTGRDFIGMSLQVADAMRFLEAKRIVHRDLAARNVLVGSSHEVLKLADFGMARIMVEDDYYRQGSDDAVPLKWMAPESIRNKVYTSASDVWSFGILMWEIASLGQPPYGARAPLEVAKLVFEGRTLNIPQGCPSRLYSHMTQCWEFRPKDRPPFSELYENLKTLLITVKFNSSSSTSSHKTEETFESMEPELQQRAFTSNPSYVSHPSKSSLDSELGHNRQVQNVPNPSYISPPNVSGFMMEEEEQDDVETSL